MVIPRFTKKMEGGIRMVADGFRIYINKSNQKIAVITGLVDFADKSFFYYGAFDAVYINMDNLHVVKAILKRINPVTCNETSYLPLFVSKKMKGRLGLHDYVIDAFIDNPTTLEVAEKIDEILENIRKRGILPETDSINTSTDIFLRIYRYKISRNDFIMKPRLVEKSATGYSYPLLELFHNLGYYHLREQFSFEQMSFEKGTFRQLHFVNKVHLCPKCQHSHLIYYETCPKCGSSQLHIEQMIHHFACANISAENTYNVGGQLVCPKCHENLRHIGIDYDRPASLYSCENCGNTFLSPVTKASCTYCETETDVKELVPHDVYEFEITPEGAENIAHSMYSFSSSNSFFDNYMTFYAFKNRLRMLIEKKINHDQIVGLALAKIWALDENGRTTVATDDVVATACRVFSTNKVAATRHILYINCTLYQGDGQQQLDEFKEKVVEGAKILASFIEPGHTQHYTFEIVGDKMADIKAYMQQLELVPNRADHVTTFDEAEHPMDISSPEAVIKHFLGMNKKISDAPVTADVPKIQDVEITNKKSFNYISWLIMIVVGALAAIIGSYLWLV